MIENRFGPDGSELLSFFSDCNQLDRIVLLHIQLINNSLVLLLDLVPFLEKPFANLEAQAHPHAEIHQGNFKHLPPVGVEVAVAFRFLGEFNDLQQDLLEILIGIDQCLLHLRQLVPEFG